VAKVRIESPTGISERFFINMIGIGFDGFVAKNIELLAQTQKKSALVYIKGLMRSLFNYEPHPMTIESSGKKISEEILSVSAGICSFTGGGMKMSPDAQWDDGLFDVTIVKKIGKANVIMNVPKLYNGKIGRHKRVEQWRVPSLKITSLQPLHIETDGEVLEQGNVELSIYPCSIWIVK
jgi:diacylglycerol kinase family enzyme